ncbi:hypothetical protein BD833_12052 [Blastococcus xanthinilyticus]|uniref:Uncharacterized protein n=2 Tax=Blastococcus xanthinilyticus TaxID=1564164 RepID=A0A5S5CLK7_9ACTN|nr:hypothetical protein BD833_12052 [Blastococcus xanthinilyticus]
MVKLKENTVVVDESGAAKPLMAGEDVPRWAAKQVGEHLLEDGKAARSSRASRSSSGSSGTAGSPDGAGGSEEPPRGGEGATEEAWRAYAEGLDIEVPDGASRDEIIALVDARP